MHLLFKSLFQDKIPILFLVLAKRLSFYLDYVVYIQKTIVLEAFSAGTSTYLSWR